MIYVFCLTYVICHEFWVPVRPTQNCAGMFILYLHVILLYGILTGFYFNQIETMICHVIMISVL